METSVSPPYQYCAFGIEFVSDRPLPELLPAAGAVASPVHLEWRDTPSELPPPSRSHGLLQANGEEFLLSIPGIARYNITRSRIAITPANGADDDTVRLFLFASALGALLDLRGILTLHGAAVRKVGHTVAAICGVSTAGKSTLAAALSQRQWEVAADDIIAIHFDQSGDPWVHPGLARGQLWSDTFEKLAIEPGPPVRPGLEKYFHTIAPMARPERLGRIYELVPSNKAGAPVQSDIFGVKAVEMVLRNIFCAGISNMLGPDPGHARRVGQLIRHTTFARITRPIRGNTVQELVSLLEGDHA